MKSKIPILRAAIVRAIMLGAACTRHALAQQNTDDASTLDTLTVTGSRISVQGLMHQARWPVLSAMSFLPPSKWRWKRC